VAGKWSTRCGVLLRTFWSLFLRFSFPLATTGPAGPEPGAGELSGVVGARQILQDRGQGGHELERQTTGSLGYQGGMAGSP
jgi:hypothetical protein